MLRRAWVVEQGRGDEGLVLSTGHTKIDDGILLFRYHHQHHQRPGWHVDMGTGIPRWKHATTAHV